MVSASPAFPDLLAVFNALPGAYLVLSPDLIIEAANDARLAVTLTERESLLGRHLFDVFPDNPQAPEAQSVRNLQASLAQVLATGQPHEMPLQRYDIPDPDRPDQFIERYWLPRNTPVLDAQGRVIHLVHSVTDMTGAMRGAAQLRESQAAEQAARTEAQAERQRFYDVLMQLPAQVAINRGPTHIFDLVNQPYQQLFPTRAIQGRPVRQALPELEGQQFFDLLDRVYQTGEPFYGQQMPAAVDFTNSGQMEMRYVDVFFQALRDEAGRIDGVLNFSYDVTEQVRARQQVEQLNRELEARVAERTQEIQRLRAAAETQYGELQRVFEQAPFAIAVFRGPEYVLDVVNPRMAAMWNRSQAELVGQLFFAALPELEGQGLRELLDEVRLTGTPFAAQEMPVWLAHHQPGKTGFYDFVYQPLRDERNQVVAITCIATDTTEKVQARRQTETLQAELLAAATRQAAERETFYQVFEQTPAPVSLLRGPRHRFEYVNPAYQQVFAGRPLVGLDFAQALPDAEEQGFLALLDHVYQTGETYFGSEIPFVSDSLGGQPHTIYFNFTYQAYREQGQVVGISSFAFDVTEQVRARQEREAQQRQLHQFFMQVPAPISFLDGPELIFRLVNPAYQQIFPNREMLGKPVLAALPELASTPVPEILRGVYRTGEAFIAQEMALLLARSADSPLEEVFFTFTYLARRNVREEIDGVLIFGAEVTNQVRARRVIEEREQSFRLLADNVPAMLWVTDSDGTCTYLNQQWYDYTGQTEEEALGLGWTRAVHPEDAAAAGTAFLNASTRQIPFNLLYRLRRYDGVYRWAIDSGLPRFGANGEFEGLVGTVVEVHEQKTAELALQRLTQKLRHSRDKAQALNTELSTTNEQLRRTNVDLDNFIYTASHDLKAPISNIEGLLLALTQQLPPTVQQAETVGPILDMMQGAVDRFKQTIGHLTDISKLQQEHAQPAEQVNLAAMIEDVRLDLLPLLVETDAQLEVAVTDCPTVAFSAKNLRSIIYNLLSNALKYHHPERAPRVHVSCRRDGGTLLEVRDNGLGLDASQQTKLFGMFQRLHTHVEGSGIGLYMVKKMVENAGGSIRVASQPDVGSVFTVWLPE